MEQLTLKELAALNRLVKKQKTRYILDINKSPYFQLPDAKCPAYIQKSRKVAAELSDLQMKLEQMILEAED